MKERSRKSIYIWRGVDLLLYLSILVPLLLSILGYLTFELGSFRCDDPSIQLNHRGNTVSKKTMVILLFGPILLLFFFTELFQVEGCGLKELMKEAGLRTLYLYIRYWIASTFNILINDILKVLTAVPRPHFIQTCQPDWDKINCTGNVVFERSLCLNENTKEVYDAMKSWPSGHAQLTAFAAVYMLIYLEKRLPGTPSLILQRWLQMLLLLAPIYSSTTRLHDHRHHVSDVVVGLVLGGLLALILTADLVPDSWTSGAPQYKDSDEENNERTKRPSRMHLLSNDYQYSDTKERERELENITRH